MAAREFTVDCAAHGTMEPDPDRDGFRCADAECGAFLAADRVHGLVTSTPDGAPEPVRLVVT